MNRLTSLKNNLTLCLVCALDCEAGPLIRHFGLKARNGGGRFRVYGSESLRLVLTGVGRENARAGTRFLAEGLSGEARAIWLNIGIAGHPSRSVGEPVIAGKIRDRETGKVWYPHLAFGPALSADSLITVGRPAVFQGGEVGKEEVLYDMEAAGFYPAALRYSSTELVHALKIVSDNREESSDHIRPGRVRAWVEKAIPEIEDTLRRLVELSEKRIPPDLVSPLIEKALGRWHFSEYQRAELQRLLRRVCALKRADRVQIEKLSKLQTSRELLGYVKAVLEVPSHSPGLKGNDRHPLH